MLTHRGYKIPIVALVLGACSVYDSSLLSKSSAVADSGSAGEADARAGAAGGAHAGAGPDDDAGAAGAAAGDSGGPAGGTAGGGILGGSGSAGAVMSTSGAGGSTGGGGAGGSGASGGHAGSAGAPVVLDLELIDDMESNDGVIESSNGRGGDWYDYNDLTPSGTQLPGEPFKASALGVGDPRYAKSKLAAMTSGAGFTGWGENLGFNLKLANSTTKKLSSYNASAYCGLHFYAKVGVGVTHNKALLRVIDKNSHPDGGVCGGGGMPCYQYFQKQLTFSTDWQEENVLFSDLSNSGWPTALVVTDIFSVEFGLDPSSTFELWVDDISFLKKPSSGVCPKSL